MSIIVVVTSLWPRMPETRSWYLRTSKNCCYLKLNDILSFSHPKDDVGWLLRKIRTNQDGWFPSYLIWMDDLISAFSLHQFLVQNGFAAFAFFRFSEVRSKTARQRRMLGWSKRVDPGRSCNIPTWGWEITLDSTGPSYPSISVNPAWHWNVWLSTVSLFFWGVRQPVPVTTSGIGVVALDSQGHSVRTTQSSGFHMVHLMRIYICMWFIITAGLFEDLRWPAQNVRVCFNKSCTILSHIYPYIPCINLTNVDSFISYESHQPESFLPGFSVSNRDPIHQDPATRFGLQIMLFPKPPTPNPHQIWARNTAVTSITDQENK